MPTHPRPTSGPLAVRVLAAALALAALARPGGRAVADLADPANDFIPTYGASEPHTGDLDVVAIDAVLDITNGIPNATLTLKGVLAGPISAASNYFYIWGINRGSPLSNFASVNNPGVVFDAVVALRGDGTGTVRDLATGQATVLTPSQVSVAGATITAIMPIALFPSRGFAPTAYTVNLWPRTRTGAGTDSAISDFAPDNTMAPVSVVPEPGSVALLGLGGAALLGHCIRRRVARTA